jgi:release factor glutamine methyltransferase
MITDWLERIQREVTPLSDSAALDAQVLLAHVLGQRRAWLLAHPEAALTAGQEARLAAALECLEAGVPLPYVLGRWEFYGLDFKLTRDTLIPRPETETLVELALGWCQAHPGRRRIADIGTGSGCIAVTLAVHIPDLRLLATDASLAALQVARQNACMHGVSGQIAFVCCDLLAGVGGRFDLLCANLPYIPSSEMAGLAVARREPPLALDGGQDGLAPIRQLLDSAPKALAPGGALLLEIGAGQGDAARPLAQAAFPGADVHIYRDLAGKDRVLQVAQRTL